MLYTGCCDDIFQCQKCCPIRQAVLAIEKKTANVVWKKTQQFGKCLLTISYIFLNIVKSNDYTATVT